MPKPARAQSLGFLMSDVLRGLLQPSYQNNTIQMKYCCQFAVNAPVWLFLYQAKRSYGHLALVK
jgi:hypothetical protein